MLSIRYGSSRVEVGTVSDVPDTGPIDMREGLRWQYQTARDERLFEIAWLQDDGRRTAFRAGWQHDLALEHARYKARMEAL